MKYVLDTNICIYLINGIHHKNILKKIQEHERENIILSSIVLSELEFGIAGSTKKTESRKKLFEFSIQFSLTDFDIAAAKAYGDIRYTLEHQGTPIGANDYFIAAHALALNATLITNNTKEFSRIPNLRLANWTL